MVLRMNDKWSGMVVNAKAGSGIASVTGQWTVPTIKPTVSGASSCYVWIGIDGGDGPRYLLQAGIGCDVKGGKLSINAWWEWLPLPTHPSEGSFSVSAGDKIVCTITGHLGTNTATISLQNLRTGKFAFPNPVKGLNGVQLQGSCAEWVVEAPLENRVPTTLSNYTQVQFSGCSAYDESSKTTLDPNGGTPLNLKRNGQTVSRGSSPGAGQVTCTYAGPDTSRSLPAPNAISSRILPTENVIASRSFSAGSPLQLT